MEDYLYKTPFRIEVETDTFIVCKDMEDPDGDLITSSADWVIHELSKQTYFRRRRVFWYGKQSGWFELLYSKDGLEPEFAGRRRLTDAQLCIVKAIVER